MKTNPRYLRYHDLIGFYAYAKLISKKKNETYQDIGMIIDDTKNMLITKKNKVTKKYIKKDHIFRIRLPSENNDGKEDLLEVEGTKIIGRPENRLRNLRKKRWLR
ncbi:MAG: ribonuclease P protein subunit [Promethearchaeota archaeon]